MSSHFIQQPLYLASLFNCIAQFSISRKNKAMRKIPLNVSSIICSLQPNKATSLTIQSTGFQRLTARSLSNPNLITAVKSSSFTK